MGRGTDFSKASLGKFARRIEGINKTYVYEQWEEKMYNIIHELLSGRAPSPYYSVFLYEKLTLFKIKSLMEGITYQFVTYSHFLVGFVHTDFPKKNFHCELYLQ